MSDAKAFAAIVRDFFARQVEPLLARIAALESRAPVPGLKGDPGEPGGKGEPGLPGKDGESIHPDTVRAMVADLVRLEVERIPCPKDGADGKDATAIDYRDGIDDGKSYPKGTHALYRGGLIVATRATDPLLGGDLTAAGWAVMINGIAEEYEEISEDGRTFSRATVYTNGQRFERTHKTAMVKYCGVWLHDREYSRGDMATRDGSVWHCQAETTKEEPGRSDDWKLAVKRGNHGKDGKP